MKVTYQKAYDFAECKHAGQLRFDGSEYITHPEAVANQLHSEEERIVAILHDILDETDTSVEELRQLGLTDEMLEALRLLYHNWECDSYGEYIKKLALHPLARPVKLADIENNLHTIEKVPEPQRTLLRNRYNLARNVLQNRAPLTAC